MKNYTATTTNATNMITAIAANPSTTIEIEVNGNVHQNSTAAAWRTGENTVVIVTENGGESEVYTVIVTKS